MITIHYAEGGAPTTVCGRDATRLARSDEPSEANCKRCLHALNAPTFIGQHRTRKQFKLVCVGGPWGGREVVFPKQDADELPLPIRVGEHVGRYNLNTGHWVPLEKAE